MFLLQNPVFCMWVVAKNCMDGGQQQQQQLQHVDIAVAHCNAKDISPWLFHDVIEEIRNGILLVASRTVINFDVYIYTMCGQMDSLVNEFQQHKYREGDYPNNSYNNQDMKMMFRFGIPNNNSSSNNSTVRVHIESLPNRGRDMLAYAYHIIHQYYYKYAGSTTPNRIVYFLKDSMRDHPVLKGKKLMVPLQESAQVAARNDSNPNFFLCLQKPDSNGIDDIVYNHQQSAATTNHPTPGKKHLKLVLEASMYHVRQEVWKFRLPRYTSAHNTHKNKEFFANRNKKRKTNTTTPQKYFYDTNYVVANHTMYQFLLMYSTLTAVQVVVVIVVPYHHCYLMR